jgi:NCS1 family nucleobase:cation symporter-1
LLIVVFIAGAWVTWSELVATTPEATGFAEIANARIWTGEVAAGGGERLGFWHIAAFAWICNMAMHLGLSDMAIFRYARHSRYGLNSACGMFIGHYLAWVCAGIMGAAAALATQRPLAELDAGAVAYHALGIVGAIAVVVAGWSTSNPTLYRAGLALQALTPGWPRWKVTLAAGVVTTLVACSPFVFTELLGFVGLYGVLLAPVGGIVVAEHWLFPRLGMARFWAAGRTVNGAALIAWLVSSGGALLLWQLGAAHLFFVAVPAWLAAGVIYTVLARTAGAVDRHPSQATSQPLR